MNSAAPPALTVRYDGSQRTFAAGHDIVVGRDLRADMRITHPLISRAHLLLRFEQGRWRAIDNGSLNGTYVNGRRAPTIDLHDGQTVNIGNPDGPALSFEIGRHDGVAGRPPQTTSMPIARAGAPLRPGPGPGPQQPHRPPPGPRQGPPPGPGPRPYPGGPPQQPHPGQRPPAYPQHQAPPPIRQPAPVPVDAAPKTQMGPAPVISTPPEAGNLATKMIQAILPGSSTPNKPAGSMTIGRANDNDIVIQDVLASRHHAFLVDSPLGTEIRDASSVNGTFVNGVRVGSAVLNEGDIVTIGNIDLAFNDGTLVRRTEAATRTGGLEVNGVHFRIDGKELLDGISLTARPGTLTAIIGGSGAGKTTLSRLIAGYTRPSSGNVTFEGHDLHAEYATMRSRIGMVPQDDVVHRQLTVNQALGYAAELRLPPDTSKEERAQVVAQVLEELDMTKHANTRVDKLSGGQRKRASVALELLTQPSLLLLDEPTSGLDPALDRQVMLMLRQLADAGRVVLVVTHSVSYLDVCDQILLLAPGGRMAFNGPPSQVGEALGTTNWADIFANVGADPDEANRRFVERGGRSEAKPPDKQSPADLGEPVHTDLFRQLSTIARRQVRLVISDRGYSIFLAVLPFLIGALSLTVKGPKPGLGPADPLGLAPTQPQYIMVLLNIGAVFMGTALTIRDLIGERPIFRREQAVGLSTTAYLLAKVSVFCLFATTQAAIATFIVRLGKGAPTAHPPFFGDSTFALFITVAGTCVASAILGMLMSAVAQTTEQIMPLLVVTIMSQLVLAGGMIPVTGRAGLNQLSWITPGRWGYAAGASSIDFPSLVKVKQIPTNDPIWQHSQHIFFFDLGMLLALSLAYAGYVRWSIRLKR
ncbi:ATP-binding cassette domain-containing protein [Candidatus Mycobacterium wuenschmannii]|uniref:ATP-binding cassette domain-containing protein n=1 Tax=Candidatus Mycobacterium wuenschmannii TaxID=3027808 RepID=A0ABY8VVN9_9MYCO|nr:FHA domain-containing protein [Candidatus Mycobacterium wuenschmannii]WIM87724.1 ATP-binding cassette domain-containing protein [Candidatus Mycobacterium wuenschmannii]